MFKDFSYSQHFHNDYEFCGDDYNHFRIDCQVFKSPGFIIYFAFGDQEPLL